MKKPQSKPITTILVISMGFLAFYLKFHAQWLLIVSFVVGLAGILSPALAAIIDKGWMKLTEVLALIVPNILLSVVFYVFLFPIAQLAKLFSKKDSLMLSPKRTTTFIEVNKTFEPKDLEVPW